MCKMIYLLHKTNFLPNTRLAKLNKLTQKGLKEMGNIFSVCFTDGDGYFCKPNILNSFVQNLILSHAVHLQIKVSSWRNHVQQNYIFIFKWVFLHSRKLGKHSSKSFMVRTSYQRQMTLGFQDPPERESVAPICLLPNKCREVLKWALVFLKAVNFQERFENICLDSVTSLLCEYGHKCTPCLGRCTPLAAFFFLN